MNKVLFLGLLILSGCYVSEELPPDQQFWEYDQPANYDFRESSLKRLDSLIKAQTFGSINSLMIIKDHHILFENYYDESFRSRLRPIDLATYGYAVAFLDFFIQDGLIGNLDEPIYTFLPEYEDIFEENPDKKLITFRHLLLETGGLEWNQTVVNSNNQQSDFFLMKLSTDWVRYILEKDLASTPGSRLVLNSSSGLVLFKIFQNLLGEIALEDFLDKRYFSPLAITNYSWSRDPQGTLDGATGLSLTTFDHAKFATLMINEGRTPAKLRIFQNEWVFEMTRVQSQFSTVYDLGLGWRLFKTGTTSAFDLTGYMYLPGENGQHLYLKPDEGLIMAVGAENYFQHILFNSSFFLFYNIVVTTTVN